MAPVLFIGYKIRWLLLVQSLLRWSFVRGAVWWRDAVQGGMGCSLRADTPLCAKVCQWLTWMLLPLWACWRTLAGEQHSQVFWENPRTSWSCSIDSKDNLIQSLATLIPSPPGSQIRDGPLSWESIWPGSCRIKSCCFLAAASKCQVLLQRWSFAASRSFEHFVVSLELMLYFLALT